MSIFLSTLKKPYFDNMIGQVMMVFSTFIIIKERIKDDLKNSKLIDIEASQTIGKK